MMMCVVATVLSTLAFGTRTDTTLGVRPGTRLDVNNFGGEIAVQVWERNAVRVEATHSSRVQVVIEGTGSSVEVRARSSRGVPLPGRVDYRITVPRWMALVLSGIYTDVSVEGTKGEVSVETVKGDVNVRGGEGFVKLSSIQGSVTVDGARGRLEASSVNEGVNVSDVVGDVSVEAVNGDVQLRGIVSLLVEAATVNGDVTYIGAVRDGGRYRFASHNGDLIVAIPERANATVSVATFDGEFESSFPVQLTEARKGRRFNFTLGSGSAQIDLETFDGTIKLSRAVMIRGIQRATRHPRMHEVPEEVVKEKEESP